MDRGPEMMLNDIGLKLRDILDVYPEALADRRLLKNVLNDTFSAEEVSLLLNGFDSGMLPLRTLPESEFSARRAQMQERLMQDFGIQEDEAVWIVDTWTAALCTGVGGLTDEVEGIFNSSVIERLKDCFDIMVVYKDLNQNNFISSFKLPSYMRDFILKEFQDDDGAVDVDAAAEFIRSFIPGRKSGNRYRIELSTTVKLSNCLRRSLST